jgi:regulator of cell morphogenesis and NO signaling
MTIGEIVASDYRTAAVFQRHGIDFCCNGARTLERACRDAGADTAAFVRELEKVTSRPDQLLPRFNSWDVPALVSYIVANHHAYVREMLPLLISHSGKIADVHRHRHPELPRVAQLVRQIADEMTAHMMKEEQILFPYIVRLAAAKARGLAAPSAPFASIVNPIHKMEAEHESAGHIMLELRELTDGFKRPDDACSTYAACLQELEAFERDLHTHVHLENNLLFPKASALETATTEAAGQRPQESFASGVSRADKPFVQ